MGLLDAIWHLINFGLPALGVAAFAAAAAKCVWRSALGRVTWLRLATWAFAAGLAAWVAGLLVFGRDGRMASYGMLLLAEAMALWWAGLRPRSLKGRRPR